MIIVFGIGPFNPEGGVSACEIHVIPSGFGFLLQFSIILPSLRD